MQFPIATVLVDHPANPLPLSVEVDVARHLRMTSVTDAEYSILTGLTQAAVEHVENVTRRALTRRTIVATYDRLGAMEMPFPPLFEVTSVTYLDVAGARVTLDPLTYQVRAGEPAHLELAYGKSWPDIYPECGHVEVTLETGYETLPPSLRLALLMIIAQWYENPEGMLAGAQSSLPIGVGILLSPFAIRHFGG